MVKNSKTSLQREIASLKEKKRKALKQKKQLLDRQKELSEIKQLEREVEFLKGVGTKRRVAKEVGMKIGKQAGSFGWKGLKFAGRLIKSRIAAEVREQAMERASMNKPKSRPRVMANFKTRKVVKRKPKSRPRVMANFKTRKVVKRKPKIKNKRRVNKRK